MSVTISRNNNVFHLNTEHKVNNKKSEKNNNKVAGIIKSVANTSATLEGKYLFKGFDNDASIESKGVKKSLKELVKNSILVPDSRVAAKENFLNTARFNNIRRDVSLIEQSRLSEDRHHVMNGDIRSLIGKGVISSHSYNNTLPIKCDYIRMDKDVKSLTRDISKKETGLVSYNGGDIVASEVIPGTPIGNYYNQQKYDSSLNVMQLNNGNCGTIGFKFNLTQLNKDNPLLIHCGQLSGCTVVYAQKGDDFFAFHTGKPGNDNSSWKTGINGVQSIIDSHRKLSGSASGSDFKANNQGLADYLADNFDFSSMAFCGHGESVSGKENVTVFDYNKSSKLVGNDKVRVANAMTLLSLKDDVPHIKTMSDDMIIDKNNLVTKSIANVTSGPVNLPRHTPANTDGS